MLEYVKNVEPKNSTIQKDDSDFITIPKDEYNRLVFEREEYRSISLELAKRIPSIQKVADNIDKILAKGGASQ